MINLTDTHCHIHEALARDNTSNPTYNLWQKEPNLTPEKMLEESVKEGVTRLICVGTTLQDSELAIEFVRKHKRCWASIGIHPHEAKDYVNDIQKQQAFAGLATEPKVVAVGECGLDYFYEHSSRRDQYALLEFQLELAKKHDLPMIFHVREAFADFFPIFDNFQGIRGVVHSFTGTTKEMEQIVSRGLYIGLNGIMTFTKNDEQLSMAKAVPIKNLLLETDAPFLTPKPFRGTICKPKFVRLTAEFLSNLREESFEELSAVTTSNAVKLFNLR
jgi:TatD DNase family protein